MRTYLSFLLLALADGSPVPNKRVLSPGDETPRTIGLAANVTNPIDKSLTPNPTNKIGLTPNEVRTSEKEQQTLMSILVNGKPTYYPCGTPTYPLDDFEKQWVAMMPDRSGQRPHSPTAADGPPGTLWDGYKWDDARKWCPMYHLINYNYNAKWAYLKAVNDEIADKEAWIAEAEAKVLVFKERVAELKKGKEFPEAEFHNDQANFRKIEATWPYGVCP